MDGIVSNLVRQQSEKVLKELLRQILKREPVPEDARLLTIGTSPQFYTESGDTYQLVSYNSIQVGRMVMKFTTFEVTVTFEPSKQYRQEQP